MTKERNTMQINKTLGVLLIVFAVIGLVAVIGGGVFLGMRIGQRPVEVAETKEVNEEKSEDINEIIVEEAEKKADEELPVNKVQLQGEFAEVEVPEETASETEEEADFSDDTLRIVYMGDSIFDFHRDDGTSVPQLTSERLGAQYINLAIGGTCASLGPDNEVYNEKWDSTSGVGMARAMAGMIDPECFLDCTAKHLVKEYQGEFDKADIFVVEYGINDFLSNHPISNLDQYYPLKNYHQALEDIVDTLKKVSPKAKIILCKPSYCEFWGPNGKYLGNSYVMPNDFGTLFDYGGKVDCADDPEKGVYSFDTLVENGINMYSSEECLEDGIHLTQYGREKYAEMLSDYIDRTILNPDAYPPATPNPEGDDNNNDSSDENN